MSRSNSRARSDSLKAAAAGVPGHHDATEPLKIDFEEFASESVDLLCVAKTDGYFYWLNKRWEQLLGWTRDELMARPFMDFVHPDDVAGTLAEVETLGEGAETLFFINRYQDKQGNWHWMEWNARPAANGLIYANCRNISHHREQLTEAERQLRLLQLAEEIGGVGHWRVDLKNEELYWSPQVFRIHGLDPANFTPTLSNGINAYHPDDRGEVTRCVEKAIQNQEPFYFRLRLIRADGSTRVVESSGRPDVDPISKETRALFGVFHDITERDLELRRSNEDLRQFAYAASHDLQAPLRTLMGFGQLLRDTEENLSQESLRYLDRMVKSANRMQALIAELYKYAAVLKNDEEFTAVDLNDVLDEVSEALSVEIETSKANLVVNKLPVVRGRRAQLVSLFLHLLGNSIKFRADRRLNISVSAERLGSLHRVVVKDNGMGFESKQGERIFGLFQRLHRREAFEGMGVGLALVKRIVENHGGRIQVDATPGEGATFTLTLQEYPEPAA